jgi:hypothetical protein
MLLAIDDLQWVDDLSLGLIHYLLQAAAATRQALIVIAAARPAPPSQRPSVTASMSSFRPDSASRSSWGPLRCRKGCHSHTP